MVMQKTKNSKFRSRGFTIVELLIANFIAALAFVVLFYVAFTIQDNIGTTQGVLGISEKGRFAIDHISRDVREARAVLSSYSAYITDDDTIVLSLPAIDLNGNIIEPIIFFDKIIYTLDPIDPETLLRIVVADSASSRNSDQEDITKNMFSIVFSSGGTGLSSVFDKGTIRTVGINIITTTVTAGVSRQNEIITSVSLRNKSLGY